MKSDIFQSDQIYQNYGYARHFRITQPYLKALTKLKSLKYRGLVCYCTVITQAYCLFLLVRDRFSVWYMSTVHGAVA
jgi:hypothetical protein